MAVADQTEEELRRHMVGYMTIPDPLALARKHACASPAWLPDVFATIYDLLTAGGPALDLKAAHDVIPPDFERQHFRPLLHLQDSSLGDLTPELRATLCTALAALDPTDHDSAHWATVLNVARLIDRVFRGLSHAHDARKFLSSYRAEMSSPHMLVRDEEVGGFVLPRAVDPLQHPKTVADLFQYLLRAPARPNCQVDYRLVNRANSPSSTSLKVGFIPLIHEVNDLDWKITGNKYGVEVPGCTEAEVVRELPEILDWLATHEPDFILVPELVSSPKIVETIARWRAANWTSPRPYLILAGSHLFAEPTHKGKVRNRAVVIGPSGAELWDQHKLHTYTFTVAHQRLGGWDKVVPARPLEEDIQVSPWRVRLRDIDGRRYVVAICEDFARESPHQGVIMQFGVTHAFVPIMNPQREHGDWLSRYAISMAQDPGMISMVANSGTLVRRSPTTAEDYSMLIHPVRMNGKIIGEFRRTASGPIIALVREL